MITFDYYNNPDIVRYIASEIAYIQNREDREDCQQEIWAELYDFMPLDVHDSKRLIKRVCEKFKRGTTRTMHNETVLEALFDA